MALVSSASRRERKIGAGAGVGVEQSDVFGGEREAALGVAQVFDGVGEEDELGRSPRSAQPPPLVKRQNFMRLSTAGKIGPSFSKSKRLDERLLLHHVLEEELGGVVGGDAGGQHAADAAAVVQQVAHALGEDGVDVDVAPAAERIAAAVAQRWLSPRPCASRRGTAGRVSGSPALSASISRLRAAALGALAISGCARRTTPSPGASPAPTADCRARSRSRPWRTPPGRPDASGRTGIGREALDFCTSGPGVRAFGSS